MKTVTLYPCMGHTERQEGRGAMREVCYASTKSVADAIMGHPLFYDKWGVMGGDNCGTSSAKAMTVYDSLEEYIEAVSDETIRRRALSKLSQDERRVLGL